MKIFRFPLDDSIIQSSTCSTPMKPKRKPPAKAKRRQAGREINGCKLTLGSRIHHARKEADLTQRELAHAIGYQGAGAGAYISRVESDLETPRLENLSLIAKALRVNICALLP